MRSTSAKIPPSLLPWQCMVLGVDPATKCGVSLFSRGRYFDSGVCNGFDVDQIERWIGAARYFAKTMELPLVLVLEKPPRGGAAFKGRNPAGPAHVIGCRKLWTTTWQKMKVVTRLRCDVYPVTWRSQVLGITRGPTLERTELLHAQRLAGKSMASGDEAVAVLIAEWGSHAGVVGELLKGGGRAAGRKGRGPRSERHNAKVVAGR